jgi:hypothetical protein
VYFDYKDQETQNGKNIAASLVRQLATRLNRLEPNLEKTYDEFTHGSQKPEFSTLIELLTSCSKEFQSSYIILDALDECSESQRPEILELIRQLSAPESPFKVLATSRHHPRNVQGLFESAPTIEITAQEPDIRNYLKSKLGQEDTMTLELKEMIMSKLVLNAQGM